MTYPNKSLPKIPFLHSVSCLLCLNPVFISVVKPVRFESGAQTAKNLPVDPHIREGLCILHQTKRIVIFEILGKGCGHLVHDIVFRSL